MKTAMQELFENLESIDIKVPNGVKLIFIEKEKQHTMNAFAAGSAECESYWTDEPLFYNGDSKNYYNETFKK